MIHAVWEKTGSIWYRYKDSIWRTPERVSAMVLNPSKTPFLDVINDTIVHVTWASEQTTGMDVIKHRARHVGFGCTWGTIFQPSGSDLVTASQPVMVGGPGGVHAVWSEVPTGGPGGSSIYYARWNGLTWDSPAFCCGLPGPDNYPVALQRLQYTNARLDVVWTNGNSTPFHVANSNIDLGRCGLNGTQSAQVRDHLPSVFSLSEPFPSPFNERVLIRYEVPCSARVTLKVYDVAGRLVHTLADRTEKRGRYSVEWNGSDDLARQVPAGVYFARMESADFSATMKMVLLR
jgi:hypothetical protein